MNQILEPILEVLEGDTNNSLARIAEAGERTAFALERIAAALENGAAPAAAGQAQPPQAYGDTFAGFPCNGELVDVSGLPKMIIAPNGKPAHLRKSDGDRWYSVYSGTDDNGKKMYDRILTFKEGEAVPAVKRATPPPADAAAPANETPPQASPPAAAVPQADQKLIAKIHTVGRDIYGDDWAQTGPAMILTHTNGKGQASKDLTQAQAEELLKTLQENEIPF